MKKIKLLILNNLKFIVIVQLALLIMLISMLFEKSDQLNAVKEISNVTDSQILLYRLPKTE